MLKTDNIRKWLDALESGKYRHCKHKLRVGDFYCSLGVLCDVAKQELGLEWFLGEDGFYRFQGCDISLPLSVVVWLGEPYFTFDLYEIGSNGYTFFDYSGSDIRDLNDSSGSYESCIKFLKRVLNEQSN
jgi:hypothetical protein